MDSMASTTAARTPASVSSWRMSRKRLRGGFRARIAKVGDGLAACFRVRRKQLQFVDGLNEHVTHRGVLFRLARLLQDGNQRRVLHVAQAQSG